MNYSQKSRLIYMDYFRGIAMLLIVAGHSYNNWKADGLLEISIVDTVTGGTALFVFISGFFFYSIFYKDFVYQNFLRKKAVNVLIPYLILSFLAIGLGLFVTGETNYPVQLSTDPLLNNVYGSVLNLLTGNSLLAYWFIPFIMLVFIASPIFIWFIRQGKGLQTVILTTLFGLSLVVQRHNPDTSIIHSFVYFTPFYLFGIFYSQNRDAIDELIGRTSSLIIITLMLVGTIVGMASLGQVGNMIKPNIFDWNGFDLMVVQKILFILFLLSTLRKIEHVSLPALQFIASMSFAIFFIHTWVYSLLRKGLFSEVQHGILGFLGIFALTISITIIAALIVKRIFGKRSRYLIGW